MNYAWETTSRYCFKTHSFILSIPYQHKVQPIVNIVKYIPQFQRLELHGTFQKTPTFEYIDEEKDTEYPKMISYDKRPVYGLYNGVWRLEENEKMDLR